MNFLRVTTSERGCLVKTTFEQLASGDLVEHVELQADPVIESVDEPEYLDWFGERS